jgi:hypothetical protein
VPFSAQICYRVSGFLEFFYAFFFNSLLWRCGLLVFFWFGHSCSVAVANWDVVFTQCMQFPHVVVSVPDAEACSFVVFFDLIKIDGL